MHVTYLNLWWFQMLYRVGKDIITLLWENKLGVDVDVVFHSCRIS
jgi:hypothetical protein